MNRVVHTLNTTLLILLMSFASYIHAEDAPESTENAEGEGEPTTAAIYIPLKPQFVVNYGGVGKRHYLKAEVSLRLANSNAANSVRHHMPFIRNNLVMLFSRQTNETLESQDGREALRQEALSEVRTLLAREDGTAEEEVVDVLFNAFTWH